MAMGMKWFLRTEFLQVKKAAPGALLFLASVFLLGCEKDIEIDLATETPKLVVEATIENGQPPLVILTRSLDYYASVSPQLLASSFVSGADVFISDNAGTHKLKEYSRSLGPFRLTYYTIDSTDLSTAIFGRLNQQYSLRIVADGVEYNASTSIPGLTKRIDSVWWKAAPPQADPDQVIVMVKATDPPGFGDYIRYYTSRNNGPLLSPFSSTFDDLFIDGTTYELPVEPGIDRNQEITDRDRFFLKGDTVTLKLSNIDKATYDFWRTMEFAYASVGNPFATPIKVQSNISGNALGYFGGYASQYRTLIIPK